MQKADTLIIIIAIEQETISLSLHLQTLNHLHVYIMHYQSLKLSQLYRVALFEVAEKLI